MRAVAICALALACGLSPVASDAQPEPAAAPTAKPRPTSASPAQTPEQPQAETSTQVPADAPRSPAEAVVSAVSLERIKRGLSQAPPRPSSRAPLKLEYYVEVLGVAPPFSLFEMYDMDTGRIPYSAPSYSDMRNVLTPAEFRAPVVWLNRAARSGTRTILDRSAQRSRARRAEEDRRKALQAERDRQEQLKNSVVVK